MKQNKLFLGLATLFAVAFTFTACSSDDAESQSVQQDRTIRLTSSVERGSTRATEDPQSSTSLSTNSKLAIWAINTTADPDAALPNGNNEQYTVDNSGNLEPSTSGHTMNWPNEATLNFYAYAPYNSGYSYNAANTFSVQTDQTSTENYLASDLVLAQATSKTYDKNTPVALGFKHLLSKINITINKAENATVDLSKAKVTITNTKLKTNFKPSATDESSDKILTEVTTDNDATNILAVSALGTATTACAIIVPQQIAAGTALVKIETTSGATSGANRTLIAKLSETTTFASGQSYNFTVTVNDADAGTTQEVALQLGSASLVTWGSNDLGAVTEEPYTIGDYVLSDGTFMRASEYSSASDEDKAKIRAIIFSTTVDNNDSEYDGYAMGVVRMGNKYFLSDGTNHYTTQITAGPSADSEATKIGKSTLANALALLNGNNLTTIVKKNSNYETYKAISFFNLDTYTNNNTLTGTNLSGWFVPSFGQLVAIFNNLGGAGITSDCISWTDENSNSITAESTNDLSNSKSFYTSTSTEAVTNINSRLTAIGKTGDLTDKSLATATENGTAMWIIKTSSTGTYELSRSAGKSTGNRSIMPCIAYKLPAQ